MPAQAISGHFETIEIACLFQSVQ